MNWGAPATNKWAPAATGKDEKNSTSTEEDGGWDSSTGYTAGASAASGPDISEENWDLDAPYAAKFNPQQRIHDLRSQGYAYIK